MLVWSYFKSSCGPLGSLLRPSRGPRSPGWEPAVWFENPWVKSPIASHSTICCLVWCYHQFNLSVITESPVVSFLSKERLSVAERKRFTCPYCGKIFGRHQDMEQHKRIHTGERPFRCTVCNKSFRQRSVLIVHRKIHTGEKPFECFICFRRFYGSGDLKTHMGTHTGVRPHCCPLCSKSFPRPSSLQAHMQSHLNKFQECDVLTAGADTLIPEEEDHGEPDDVEGVCGVSASSQLSALLSGNPGASKDSMFSSCLCSKIVV